jgi:hypothetical protein
MERVDVGGLSLDSCPGHGVWFDADELRRVRGMAGSRGVLRLEADQRLSQGRPPEGRSLFLGDNRWWVDPAPRGRYVDEPLLDALLRLLLG